MSSLNHIDKIALEKLLEMGDGYVLNFSDKTFARFVVESTGKDIDDNRYRIKGNSKAKRLRVFWEIEQNHVVGRLLSDLLRYYQVQYADRDEVTLYKECHRIAEGLLQDTQIQDIEAITPNTEGWDFEILAKSVRNSIMRNELEVGLDRLHTFVVKYTQVLCEKHGIKLDRAKSLNSLFGEYVKVIRSKDLIETGMSEKILTSCISIFEEFNHVRNKRSLAHPNPILNYSESLLIFNYVASTIRFLGVLEGDRGVLDQKESTLAEIDDNISS